MADTPEKIEKSWEHLLPIYYIFWNNYWNSSRNDYDTLSARLFKGNEYWQLAKLNEPR